MKKTHYAPVHPGEVLQDELDETNLTQVSLAKHIGVLPKTINEICRGKRGISAEMAMKLSKALGGNPLFWLNLQQLNAISTNLKAVLRSPGLFGCLAHDTDRDLSSEPGRPRARHHRQIALHRNGCSGSPLGRATRSRQGWARETN